MTLFLHRPTLAYNKGDVLKLERQFDQKQENRVSKKCEKAQPIFSFVLQGYQKYYLG